MKSAQGSPVSIEGIPDFWNRLRSAPRKLLALDYDGTLAPFREDRMEAFPLPGTAECISKISRAPRTRVVIVSGRPVKEILELLGDLGVTIVGSQGWETRTAEGKLRQALPTPRQKRMFRSAVKDLTRLGLQDRAESKIAGLALHTRGLPKDLAESIEEELVGLWESRAAEHDVDCRRFDGGVELRAVGVDKGTALGRLLRGRSRDTFSVYVGDDQTDEDAFRAIREVGLGIKVGHPETPTEARGRLPDCAAVLDFLREWVHVSGLDES
jgi:trehalose 6-phosphate phosphatase